MLGRKRKLILFLSHHNMIHYLFFLTWSARPPYDTESARPGATAPTATPKTATAFRVGDKYKCVLKKIHGIHVLYFLETYLYVPVTKRLSKSCDDVMLTYLYKNTSFFCKIFKICRRVDYQTNSLSKRTSANRAGFDQVMWWRHSQMNLQKIQLFFQIIQN